MTTVNARDPAWAGGAIGDGIRDDTAALQAAINACIGPGTATSVARDAIASLYIPPGTYKISAPLTVRSVRGLKIIGAGDWVTRFLPAATMTSVFDLNGLYACDMGGFAVAAGAQAGTKVDNVIDLYWDVTASARSTQFVKFHDITVDCVFTTSAFRTAKNGNAPQVDSIHFDHCQAYGAWAGTGTDYQNGYFFGSGSPGNALCHWLYGCDFNGTRYGVHSEGISVNIFGWQAATTNGDAVFYITGGPQNFSVNGGRSEGAKRLIETSAFGLVGRFSLRDIEYHAEYLNADTFWCYIAAGSNWLIENCSATAAGKTPVILLGQTNYLVVNGLIVGDVAPMSQILISGVNSEYEARGLVQNNATTGALVETFRGVLRGSSAGTVRDYHGSGSPEGVITANVGSVYRRTDGGGGLGLYTKESGSGNTGWASLEGGFATVASSGTIGIPLGAKVVSVSGVTTITSVTAGYAGQVVTLVFQGILTFTDGSNLKLAGNFVTTADDAITLVCDGTNWFETGRSVN